MCSICEATGAHGLPRYGTPDAAPPDAWRALPETLYAQSQNPYAKPSLAWGDAAAQVSRWDAKWDDGNARTGAWDPSARGVGGFDENALGSAGTVTYGYLAPGAIDTRTLGIETPSDHRALTLAEIAQVERAVSLIEAVADIDFVRVASTDGAALLDRPGGADVQIVGDLATPGFAVPVYESGPGGGEITSSLVSLGTNGLAAEGSYAFLTALHEIGHAVGLAHPGAYNVSDGPLSYAQDAEYFEDSRQYSVMSYWPETSTGADFAGRYATAPMLHDVAALQRLYGANPDAYAGATTYGFGSNTDASAWTLLDASDYVIGAIWDAGGHDVIDASGYADDQVLDLRQEAFSSLGGLTHNLAIARGVTIEDAVGGAGGDLIVGNASDPLFEDVAGGAAGPDGANALSGRGGDDTLIGLSGGDLLDGGAGGDLLIGDGDASDLADFLG